MQRRGWPVLGTTLLCCLLGTQPGAAQIAPETNEPLGFPGNGPFVNPFPAAPQEAQPPDFRYQSNFPPGIGVLPTPGFTVVPRISAYEEFNDNIFQSETDRRYDFITLISPGIAISGDTPRINLKLNYNPVFRVYARTSSQDSVGQQLLANLDATVIPDQFFVRAHAFADEVPTGGGFGGLNFGVPTIGSSGFGNAALSQNRNNLSQVVSTQLFPYMVHRFGDFGTGRAGINLRQSYASQTSGTLLNSPNGPAARSYTGEAIAQFLSGPQFGRYVDLFTLDASVSSGTGVQKSASKEAISNRLGYVVTRQVLVYGELGAEHISFPNAVPNQEVTDAIWGLGVTLDPNPDSQIVLSYGHRDGITGFQGSARYALSPRTVLTARYTTGLTTDLQQIASELAVTGVNQEGNPINLETGAPISILNALTGINNNVFQNHSLVVTATTLLDRDTLALSLQHQNRVAVASSPGTPPSVNDSSTTGTVTWRHEISERASLTNSVSYGTRQLASTPPQNERFATASAQFRYQFSDKLSGTMIYHFFDRWSNVPGVSMYENIFLVGVTKTF